MASPGILLTRPPQLDRFLHATIGTERNGMDLSVHSVLARLGKDPWTEAARLAASGPPPVERTSWPLPGGP